MCCPGLSKVKVRVPGHASIACMRLPDSANSSVLKDALLDSRAALYQGITRVRGRINEMSAILTRSLILRMKIEGQVILVHLISVNAEDHKRICVLKR